MHPMQLADESVQQQGTTFSYPTAEEIAAMDINALTRLSAELKIEARRLESLRGINSVDPQIDGSMPDFVKTMLAQAQKDRQEQENFEKLPSILIDTMLRVTTELEVRKQDFMMEIKRRETAIAERAAAVEEMNARTRQREVRVQERMCKVAESTGRVEMIKENDATGGMMRSVLGNGIAEITLGTD